MSTYNFTVRATDNAGAFAERNFAISLRKTRYDRVATLGGSTGGTAFTTTYRYPSPTSGVSARSDTANVQYGDAIIFSGGRYIGLSSATRFESKEGVYWNGSTYSIPAPNGYSYGSITVTKFVGGKWMIFGTVINNTTNAYAAYEWSTTDWKTFTQVGYVSTNGSPVTVQNNYAVMSFDYDPATDTTVAFFASGANTSRGIWVRTGSTWRIALGSMVESFSNNNIASVLFAGGMWMAVNQSNFLYLSRDTSYWYTQSLLPNLDPSGGAFVYGLTYLNGRVAAFRCLNNSTTVWSTGDMGKTWVQGAVIPPSYQTTIALNLPITTIGDGYVWVNSYTTVYGSSQRFTPASLMQSGASGSYLFNGNVVGFRPYDPALPSNF